MATVQFTGVQYPGVLSFTQERLSIDEHRFVERETVDLRLQPASDHRSLQANEAFVVPASDRPTVVQVRALASSGMPPHQKSAAAVGIQRRRGISRLAKLLRDVPAFADDADFHVHVFPVLDQAKRLHQELLSYDRYEGNTCMVLRYLRNSLMNGGWNQYRQSAVALAVADGLEKACGAEAVERRHAKEMFQLLFNLGLRAAVPTTIDPVDSEDDDE